MTLPPHPPWLDYSNYTWRTVVFNLIHTIIVRYIFKFPSYLLYMENYLFHWNSSPPPKYVSLYYRRNPLGCYGQLDISDLIALIVLSCLQIWNLITSFYYFFLLVSEFISKHATAIERNPCQPTFSARQCLCSISLILTYTKIIRTNS
jgi:hypothetical protein